LLLQLLHFQLLPNQLNELIQLAGTLAVALKLNEPTASTTFNLNHESTNASFQISKLSKPLNLLSTENISKFPFQQRTFPNIQTTKSTVNREHFQIIREQ
jgi:hypothetical protein